MSIDLAKRPAEVHQVRLCSDFPHDRPFLAQSDRTRDALGSTGRGSAAPRKVSTDFEAWRDRIWEEEDQQAHKLKPQDQSRGALGGPRASPARRKPQPKAACGPLQDLLTPNVRCQIQRQGAAAMAFEGRARRQVRKVVEAFGLFF